MTIINHLQKDLNLTEFFHHQDRIARNLLRLY
jgi:hypothetical protein